jgi:hypothetical protein
MDALLNQWGYDNNMQHLKKQHAAREQDRWNPAVATLAI